MSITRDSEYMQQKVMADLANRYVKDTLQSLPRKTTDTERAIATNAAERVAAIVRHIAGMVLFHRDGTAPIELRRYMTDKAQSAIANYAPIYRDAGILFTDLPITPIELESAQAFLKARFTGYLHRSAQEYAMRKCLAAHGKRYLDYPETVRRYMAESANWEALILVVWYAAIDESTPIVPNIAD